MKREKNAERKTLLNTLLIISKLIASFRDIFYKMTL